jgi:putative phage-type endonuclease
MPGLTDKNHELRAGRVGASSVAALLDCGSPWTTPSDVYAHVVHGISNFRGNKNAVEMGHRMEDLVLRMGSDRMDVRVVANHITRVHPTLPLAVTCDAYVYGSKRRIPVEIKTASAWQSEEWADGEVPAHYLAQVQAQLMVAGGEYAHLWALIGGRDFVGRVIDADLDHPVWGQRVITERIERFWADHVEPRIPPVDATSDLLSSFIVPEGVAAASGDLKTIGEMVNDLMSEKDTLEAALNDAREGLIGAMTRDGLRLVSDEGWTAEVKPTKSGRTTLRFQRARNK